MAFIRIWGGIKDYIDGIHIYREDIQWTNRMAYGYKGRG